jgi:hypothetical protein
MAPEYYNPCNDGFPAKVWECLRRNEEFKAAFNRIAAASNFEERQLQYEAWEHCPEEPKNDYANAVLSSLPWAQAWDLGKTWRQHPAALRAKLESKFAAAMPLEWVSPSLDDYLSSGGFDGTKAIILLGEAALFLKDYHTIVVPRFIRDNKHRKAILLAIEELGRVVIPQT